jgi:dephospho-CoA kinase
MIVIGLTGSIGMGKSEVGNILRAEGIPVFDADREVHALYDSSEGAALLQHLVPEAIHEDHIDRQLLSKIIVAAPEKLAPLENLVHAEIAIRRKAFIAQARKQGRPIVVADIPLLFEKASETDFDVTIVVSSPPEVQHRRVMSRPGMTQGKLDFILGRQMSDTEKQTRADFVIHNTGTLAELRTSTLAVLSRIQAEHRL